MKLDEPEARSVRDNRLSLRGKTEGEGIPSGVTLWTRAAVYLTLGCFGYFAARPLGCGEPDGSTRYTVFQPGSKAPITAPAGAIKIVPNRTAVVTSLDLRFDPAPAAYPTPAPAAAPIPKPINVDRARLLASARTTSERPIFRSVPPAFSTRLSLDTPTKRPVQVRWSEHSTRIVWPGRSCSTLAQLASSRCAPKATRAA